MAPWPRPAPVLSTHRIGWTLPTPGGEKHPRRWWLFSPLAPWVSMSCSWKHVTNFNKYAPMRKVKSWGKQYKHQLNMSWTWVKHAITGLQWGETDQIPMGDGSWLSVTIRASSPQPWQVFFGRSRAVQLSKTRDCQFLDVSLNFILLVCLSRTCLERMGYCRLSQKAVILSLTTLAGVSNSAHLGATWNPPIHGAFPDRTPPSLDHDPVRATERRLLTSSSTFLDVWMDAMYTIEAFHSMDWFKGKFTGKPHI